MPSREVRDTEASRPGSGSVRIPKASKFTPESATYNITWNGPWSLCAFWHLKLSIKAALALYADEQRKVGICQDMLTITTNDLRISVVCPNRSSCSPHGHVWPGRGGSVCVEPAGQFHPVAADVASPVHGVLSAQPFGKGGHRELYRGFKMGPG